jgi:hypothetical protein
MCQRAIPQAVIDVKEKILTRALQTLDAAAVGSSTTSQHSTRLHTVTRSANDFSVHRTTPMLLGTLWLFLLVFILIILRRSTSVSDRSTKLLEGISRLERHIGQKVTDMEQTKRILQEENHVSCQ